MSPVLLFRDFAGGVTGGLTGGDTGGLTGGLKIRKPFVHKGFGHATGGVGTFYVFFLVHEPLSCSSEHLPDDKTSAPGKLIVCSDQRG